MILNPMCDMPEEIYKDFLADQGFDDLREIGFASFGSGGYYFSLLHGYHFGFEDEEDFGMGEGTICEIDRLDYQRNVYNHPFYDYNYEDVTYWFETSFGDGFGNLSDGLIALEIEGMDTRHGDGYYD